MRRHAVTGLLTAVLVMAGCSSHVDFADAGSLRVYRPDYPGVSAGTLTAGAGNNAVAPRTPYVYVTDALCVVAGPATLTSVRPIDPTGGMRVVTWSLTDLTGYADGTDALHARLSRPGREPIDAGCSDKSRLRGLAVTVEHTGRSPAVAHGFAVASTNGWVVVPYLVRLCAADDCGPLDLTGD